MYLGKSVSLSAVGNHSQLKPTSSATAPSTERTIESSSRPTVKRANIKDIFGTSGEDTTLYNNNNNSTTTTTATATTPSPTPNNSTSSLPSSPNERSSNNENKPIIETSTKTTSKKDTNSTQSLTASSGRTQPENDNSSS